MAQPGNDFQGIRKNSSRQRERPKIVKELALPNNERFSLIVCEMHNDVRKNKSFEIDV